MSWSNLHKHYLHQDWIESPSLFLEEIFPYLPPNGKVLEIGAGIGQDSRFFHLQGYNVISTDFSPEAVLYNQEKSILQIGQGGYDIQVVDVLKDLGEFPSENFDIVYAHLSLHYFSSVQTRKILSDVWRILKKNGIVAVLLNSKEDPEYGTGIFIEEDYYMIGEVSKRYFSKETTQEFFSESGFASIILDNAGETYKDRKKGIHNLIRYLGIKK